MKNRFLQIGLCSVMMVMASLTVSASENVSAINDAITADGAAGNNKKEDVNKAEAASNVSVANFKKQNSYGGGGGSSSGSAGNAKKSD